MKKSPKLLISDPKNPYGPNNDTQCAIIAKHPFLGVVIANLRVKYLFIMKNPKNYWSATQKTHTDQI